jgi:hypothetical protein
VWQRRKGSEANDMSMQTTIREIAVIPERIELKPTKHGYLGIFAKYDFPKGTDIYSHVFRQVSADDRIILATPFGDVPIDINAHTVRRADGLRDYFGFDSFMNHSCDPSTISVAYAGDVEINKYYTQAAKDLKAGDEITCNYLLFDWDCDGHSFDCLCGAAECFGRIAGFAGLPFDAQVRFAEHLDDPIFKRFVAESREKLSVSELSPKARLRLQNLH